MFDTLRSILGAPQENVRAPDASYQPIRDDEEDGSVGATAGRPTRVDEDKGVYWAFWALGAGVLLSWNVLICTIPLLMSFFAPNSSARATLPSTVSTVYCFGNLFFLGLAQRTVGKKSPSPRLHSSLLLLLGTSLILTFPLLPLVFPALSPSSALLLPLLVLTTLLLSVSTAYLQSSVFALSALWGSRQVLAVMSGQGGIAVLVSGVQILLAIVSSSSSSTEFEPDASPADRQSTVAGVGLWALASVGSFACMLSHRYLTRHQDYASVLSPIQHRQELEGDSTSSTKSSWAVSKRIFKKNLSLNVGVFMVFVVTLSVFPPITTSITSTHVPTPRLLQPTVFIPLHFFLFNVGDYAGRTYLPSMPMFMPKTQSRVLLLSLARVVFIPLFLMCNITPRTSASSPTINSDVAYFVIMILFGLTNGWISSLCMILASAPALNTAIAEEEKDVAGTLAAFCLVAGLAGGSIASFIVMTLFRAFYVK